MISFIHNADSLCQFHYLGHVLIPDQNKRNRTISPGKDSSRLATPVNGILPEVLCGQPILPVKGLLEQ